MIHRIIMGLPALVGFVYLTTSVLFLIQGRRDWALVYFAYAVANLGLIWAAEER